MKFLILAFSCIIVGLLIANSHAAPTTLDPITSLPSEKWTTEYTTGSTSTLNPEESTTSMGTTKSPHTGLLRQQLPMSNRLRGRVVLANTRMEGSTEWGVTADEAEMACNRIARYQSEANGSGMSLLNSFLERFLSSSPMKDESQGPAMQGHLLSIGSSYEVLALSRLLSPLPDGAYWTGGKIVRYRVNNMRRHAHTDHVVLTWTDGRVGKPSVLGLTRLDEEQLNEGYTYCLALNLKEATWQARDCEDRLPYACLITPRQIGFANKARVNRFNKESTESLTTEEELITATTAMPLGETSESVETTRNLLTQEMTTTESTTFPITEITTSMTEMENSDTSNVKQDGFSTVKGMTTASMSEQPMTGLEKQNAGLSITRNEKTSPKVIAGASSKWNNRQEKDDDDDDDDEDRTQNTTTNPIVSESTTTQNAVLSTEGVTTTSSTPLLLRTVQAEMTPTTTHMETTVSSTSTLLNEQIDQAESSSTAGHFSDKQSSQSTGGPTTAGQLEEQTSKEIEEETTD